MENQISTGQLCVTKETRIMLNRCSENRYLSYHQMAAVWATLDPVSRKPRLELLRTFFKLEKGGSPDNHGTTCWYDRFIRHCLSLPALLTMLTVLRDTMAHVFLPMMKVTHCKAALQNPGMVPKAFAGWYAELKARVVDPEALADLFQNGWADRQNAHLPHEARVADPEAAAGPDAPGPDDSAVAMGTRLDESEDRAEAAAEGAEEEEEESAGNEEIEGAEELPMGELSEAERDALVYDLRLAVCTQVMKAIDTWYTICDYTNPGKNGKKNAIDPHSLSRKELKGIMAGTADSRCCEDIFGKLGVIRKAGGNPNIRIALLEARLRVIKVQRIDPTCTLTNLRYGPDGPRLYAAAQAEGNDRYAPTLSGSQHKSHPVRRAEEYKARGVKKASAAAKATWLEARAEDASVAALLHGVNAVMNHSNMKDALKELGHDPKGPLTTQAHLAIKVLKLFLQLVESAEAPSLVGIKRLKPDHSGEPTRPELMYRALVAIDKTPSEDIVFAGAMGLPGLVFSTSRCLGTCCVPRAAAAAGGGSALASAAGPARASAQRSSAGATTGIGGDHIEARSAASDGNVEGAVVRRCRLNR